jgi:hypothetical protein
MQNNIEPVAWGFRNPYGIRFSPADHPLKGELMYSENGEDERGARPTNNAPDRIGVARQNKDGSPEWHGWPDRFGFLDSTQSVFNPKGSPADDNPALFSGKPVLPVLAFFPQQPKAPLGLEPADVAAVGLDFVPNSFVGGIVKKRRAALREGDFGFSQANFFPRRARRRLINFTRNSPTELTAASRSTASRRTGGVFDGTPAVRGETDGRSTDPRHQPSITIRFRPTAAYGRLRRGARPGRRLRDRASRIQPTPAGTDSGTGTI